MRRHAIRVWVMGLLLQLLAGCGDSGENKTTSAAPAATTGVMLVSASDQLLSAMAPKRRYRIAETVEFERHVTNLAIGAGRVWVTHEPGRLYELSPQMDGRDLVGFEVARNLNMGCSLLNLTPTPGRLWFIQPDCETQEITLVALDKASGEVLTRQIITTRNNSVRTLEAHQGYLFALVTNGFSIVRIPLDAPGNFQTLDLRPNTEGKYGHGHMAFSGGRLWVMDMQQNQVIEIDPVGWALVGSKTFADAGIDSAPLGCRSSADGVICRASNQVFRFDPASRTVAARWDSADPLRSLAVHGQTVFATHHLAVHELNTKTLAPQEPIHGLYSDHLQVVSWP